MNANSRPGGGVMGPTSGNSLWGSALVQMQQDGYNAPVDHLPVDTMSREGQSDMNSNSRPGGGVMGPTSGNSLWGSA
jgi:hypothetical protein